MKNRVGAKTTAQQQETDKGVGVSNAPETVVGRSTSPLARTGKVCNGHLVLIRILGNLHQERK